MATLKDVAALAGVSVKTVSNVVNGYPYVSDGVRRRVQQAVQTLEYRPNRSARDLRAGRDGSLTLVLPATDHPYADDLARELRRAAGDQGRRLAVERIDPDHERTRSHKPPAAPALRSAGALILLDGPPDGRHHRVAVDRVRAARDATEHLLHTGRSRIAAIDVQRLRAEPPHVTGYRQALDHAGLATAARHQLATADGRAAGYHAACALLRDHPRPDALVCASDLLAVGAVRAAVDAGRRVPEDIAVVGFGDTEEGRWSRPALSTVAVDTAFLARQAMALIADPAARPDAPPVEITAPHTVRPRESSAVALEAHAALDVDTGGLRLSGRGDPDLRPG
ncbi:LacI family DNA-binding transcriptional regulator [Micromonospora sp. NPDC050686]|uniref:LacI family DNA-binding transcriptional regulator n=1 Tax=Micromonospora sp. NPDC050686 TaxID=3154631 RepID=UPI003400494D